MFVTRFCYFIYIITLLYITFVDYVVVFSKTINIVNVAKQNL